jgi:CDP-glucose 4,6-dehydratase
MKNFYKGKRIFVTGHTGFKGSWLCRVLLELGAEVVGYSLEPNTLPNLFDISGVGKDINSHIGDIRDIETLIKVFNKEKPEIVIQLAAQPLVLESYNQPRYT